jgi:hypothetical protein
MNTLPYRRQQVTPRSGGRIAGDHRNDAGRERSHALTAGNLALQAYADPVVDERDAVAPVTGRSAATQVNGGRLRAAPPVPVRAPRAPFVALVLAVVMAGVVGILVLNTKINENAFRLKDLRDRQSRLDLQEQQLNDDLALAASPNSLAAAARRLGLVPAGSPAFIRLPDGRVLGVPQPATARQSLSGPQDAAAGR